MRLPIGTLAVVFLAGCSAEPPMTATIPASEIKTFATDGALDPRVFALQTRKSQLIDSVVALFPADRERGEYLAAALNRSDVSGIGVSGNPDAQKLTRQIVALRDSLRTLTGSRPVDVHVSLVTVGIPDEWSYGDASAVIVRKGSRDHSDTILLPTKATAGNLAQAVRAFAALDTSATTSKSGGARIVVQGAHVPPSWIAKGRDKLANAVLEDIRRKPRKRAGSVMMRSAEIGIASDSEKKSKP